jgi:hypothetical protein
MAACWGTNLSICSIVTVMPCVSSGVSAHEAVNTASGTRRLPVALTNNPRTVAHGVCRVLSGG